MKLLVLGCGSIGARHARNAAPLAEVGLHDPAPGLAKTLAAETGATAFDSVEAAWAWHPDACIVAAPNRAHLPLALEAVVAGAHLLIEKPISHTLDGVESLLDSAEVRGLKVFVGCNMRFHKGPATLHGALGEIGKPLFGRAHFGNHLPSMRPGADYRTLYFASREEGGGAILDAIHELDMMAWLLGPISAVTCDAGRIGDLEIDVEDYASLALRHRAGPRSEIHLDYLQREKRRGCELVGTEGTLVWNSEGKAPEVCSVRLYRAAAARWDEIFRSDGLDANEAYVAMLQAFLAALGNNPPTSPLLTGREAMNDLSVALSALIAAESGHRQPTEWRA